MKGESKITSVLISFLVLVSSATLLPSAEAYQPSGCEVCATTGQCSHAFKGSAGQYCGSWYDVIASVQKPCCCPLSTYCKVSQTECRCHVPATSSHGTNPAPYYYKTSTYGENDPYWFVRLLFLVLLMLCCCCCCIPGCKRKKNGDGDSASDYPPAYSNWGDGFCSTPETVPVAVPYGNPPATNPAYTPAGANYGSTDQYRGGIGRGGGGGVGAALGGLAVGTAVGSMMGRRSDGYFGGVHSGGSGGYDIAGDSGHRGGGGYDIQGDS